MPTGKTNKIVLFLDDDYQCSKTLKSLFYRAIKLAGLARSQNMRSIYEN